MTRRWIDCSPPITERLSVWPGDVEYRRTTSLSLDAGDSVNLSAIQTTLHLGSHADAPSHYERNGATIDELDVGKFIGPARVFGIRAELLSSNGRILPAGLVGNLDNLPERVLLRTDTFDPFEPYSDAFASLSPELVDWLADRGVQLIGVDTPSVDPLNDKTLASHHRLAARGVVNLEGLWLNAAKPGDYELIAVPLRIVGADASPVRALLREMP